MVDRIKAAVDARTDSDFVIMARTDALAGEGLAAAVDRACAYVEAGADMVFPEGVTKLETYTRFKNAVQVPILANRLPCTLVPRPGLACPSRDEHRVTRHQF